MLRQNNDTAPNRRRYGTSGGPWPTRGAPLARAGLEPGPGETRCDPVRSVVRIGAELRSRCGLGIQELRGTSARCGRSASGRPAAVAGSGPRSAAAGCQRARPGSAPARASRGPRRCVQGWPTPLRGCGPRPGFDTSFYPFPNPFVTEKAFSSYQYRPIPGTYLATHPSKNFSWPMIRSSIALTA